MRDIHRVDSPKDKGETSNGSEESLGLVVLGHDDGTAIDSKLINNDEVGNASHGVITPLGSSLGSKGSKETGKDHDDIGDNGNEDVGTAQAAKEAKVQKQERGGNTPVDVSSPVDFTLNDIVSVGEVLLGVLDLGLVDGDTITHSHGEVRDHGKGGDEGSQDVEQAFLLDCVSFESCRSWRASQLLTTGTRKAIT